MNLNKGLLVGLFCLYRKHQEMNKTLMYGVNSYFYDFDSISVSNKTSAKSSGVTSGWVILNRYVAFHSRHSWKISMTLYGTHRRMAMKVGHKVTAQIKTDSLNRSYR